MLATWKNQICPLGRTWKGNGRVAYCVLWVVVDIKLKQKHLLLPRIQLRGQRQNFTAANLFFQHISTSFFSPSSSSYFIPHLDSYQLISSKIFSFVLFLDALASLRSILEIHSFIHFNFFEIAVNRAYNCFKLL